MDQPKKMLKKFSAVHSPPKISCVSCLSARPTCRRSALDTVTMVVGIADIGITKLAGTTVHAPVARSLICCLLKPDISTTGFQHTLDFSCVSFFFSLFFNLMFSNLTLITSASFFISVDRYSSMSCGRNNFSFLSLHFC